jgi:hypothetical protein
LVLDRIWFSREILKLRGGWISTNMVLELSKT